MNREITKRMAQIYAAKRFQSEDRAYLRKQQILAEHPELGVLEDQLAEANAVLASRILSDGVFRNSTAERDEALALRNRYLEEHQIPRDYALAIPDCPLCKDTGFQDPVKRIPCDCYRKLVVPMLLEHSNFTELRECRFDLFEPALFSEEPTVLNASGSTSVRHQIEAIRDEALRFAEAAEEFKEDGLFFLGRPGTGKTFMAGCIANEMIHRGQFVLYLSAPELFERIGEYRVVSGSFAPGRERLERAEERYESIRSCDLLIIDDVGTETSHPNRQPELLAILNHRHGIAKKTLLTTNLAPENLLEIYDERVLSRLYGNYKVFRFPGEDIRRVKRMNRVASGKQNGD